MKLRKLLTLFVLPTTLMITGCGGSSDSDSDDDDDGGDEQVTYQVNITAASAQEVQEQSPFSIRADITGSASDSSAVTFEVDWLITDAPAEFSMPLMINPLNTDNQSIIEFETPDVDQDTTVTLQVMANISGQSGTVITKDISLTITANQEVVISGAVVDEPIPNANVEITIGDVTYQVDADENGEYELSVEYPDPDVMTLVTATGAEGQEDVLFKSYLGEGSKLIEQAGEDKVLQKDENFWVNVTNVTTAEFALIQNALDEGIEIETEEELVAARDGLNEEDVLEVAAVIKVIVDNDDIDLPAGVDNVLELVTDEAATEDFIEEVEEENPGIIEETIEDIETDGNLTDPDADTGGIIGEGGAVTLLDEDGTTTETTVVLGDEFEASKVPGRYYLTVELNANSEPETEDFTLTLEAGGDGTINFGQDEQGNADIAPVSWLVSSEGYLTFTEYATDDSGDEWYFTIVNIVDERGNALIDFDVPEAQENDPNNEDSDVRLIGTFDKLDDFAFDRAAGLIESGQVQVNGANDSVSFVSVTLGDLYTLENAPGVYDFAFTYYEGEQAFQDNGELSLNPDGTGSMTFFENDGNEVAPVDWTISPEGYLLFTEKFENSGELFYWVLAPIVDDTHNTVISVVTPPGQADAEDATVLGTFTKQVIDHVMISAQDVPGTYLWAPSMRGGSTFTFNEDGTGMVHWSPDESEPMGHPGYDDTLTWMVNAQGQLEVVITASDGTMEYDLYTFTSGTLEDGMMNLKTKSTPDGVYEDAGTYPWAATEPKQASNALVGAYVLGSGNDYNVLTILDNERYYVGHTMNAETDSQGNSTPAVSGEYGTYTWNSETGAFQATIVDESDGEGGIGETQETWTTDGTTLTIDEDNMPDSGDETSVAKLAYVDNSIVGAWYLEEANNYNIITFLDDGRYFVMHSNNGESDVNCTLQAVSGEYGTYTWDAGTGAFEATIVGQSDCMGGFSDETTGTITIHEDGYLEVDNGSNNEVDVILTKIQ